MAPNVEILQRLARLDFIVLNVPGEDAAGEFRLNVETFRNNYYLAKVMGSARARHPGYERAPARLEAAVPMTKGTTHVMICNGYGQLRKRISPLLGADHGRVCVVTRISLEHGIFLRQPAGEFHMEGTKMVFVRADGLDIDTTQQERRFGDAVIR
jgi:DNA-binding transcriptional LysR family regulator